MADRTSIWKREIRLRKRPEPRGPSTAPAPAEAKPSIWKRELHLGGKKAPVEVVPAGSEQPIYERPSLWDSPSPDSPLAPSSHEDVSTDEEAPHPLEPDPGSGARSPATPSSGTRPEGWLGASTGDLFPGGASSPRPTSGASEPEDVPAAPGPTHTSNPKWAAEDEGAPLDLDLDHAEPDSETETEGLGLYGWMDSADEPSEVASAASTAGRPGPGDEVEAVASPESILPTPPELGAGLAADRMFALTPEAVERTESEPVAARWWDSAAGEAETAGAGEAEAAPASVEPEPVPASAEPTQWYRTASPDVRSAATEPRARGREHQLALSPPAPVEQVEPPLSVGWTQQEEAERESEAAAPAEDAGLAWPPPEQNEPLKPVSGWEQALTAPKDEAPTEPEKDVTAAGPVARTKVPGPQGPKPSLLKRELRLPRSLRRAQKPSSVKASDAHPIKNIVGLRIGSSQLAAAYVHNNGAAELVQVARTPLARGIVTGGEVRDPEALTGALKKFFAEHKLPRRGIRLGIASNRIGVRILEVPALEDPRLFENSIRFHAQETLPISVSDAIIDHVVLGAGADGGLEPTVRVLLVFAHRELVNRHVQACRRAGLKLEGIDFEAFALLRALGAPRSVEIEPTRAVVAVAIGQERTIFAVSDGRICDFTRVLEWGGGSLDVSIARALNLTPSQAGPLKLALSLDGDAAPSSLTPEQAQTARAAIRTELQSLSRELVSSLQFYQARPGSLDIGEIMLSGGGAELDGLAAELERLVGVPVVAGDPFTRVEVGRKVSRPAEAGSLAIAIGLGIED